MKKLNLTKMYKEMDSKDKARILFAHNNLVFSSKGQEKLLTTAEEREIIIDAQNKGQVDELNRLTQIYNLCNFIVINIETLILNLELSIESINKYVLYVYKQDEMHDKLRGFLHMARNEDSKTNSTLIKEFEKEIKNINREPSFFQPFKPQSKDKKRVPNVRLQEMFVYVFKAYKKLMQALYSVDFLNKQNDFDFISDKDKEVIDKAKKASEEFSQLDGCLVILKLYQRYAEYKLIKKEAIEEAEFSDLVFNFNTTIELTDEEKSEMEIKTTEALEKKF
ncbi:hypothetical protein HON22_03920 [Candidatus Peregrinibacteria bacterium]|jgi:hypothetical protein|nr:hypothetical protein [Candidatus Peregrinibacteria bacterium]